LHRGLPAGGKDIAEKKHLRIGQAVRDFDRRHVGIGHAHVFGLAAGIAAGQVRVAEQTRRGMAEHLVGDVLVAIAAFADRPVAALALLALSATDREWDHDPVADLQLLVFTTDLDDLAHELVAHDVARLHAGHEAVVEMQVGTADGAARDPDDRITRMLDLRIGNFIAADVGLTVPAQGPHDASPQYDGTHSRRTRERHDQDGNDVGASGGFDATRVSVGLRLSISSFG
jgi:hypothetical protein